MQEKIYTIPVNEAFEKYDCCPLCTINNDIEKREIERILGPAMMEPDVRIETNKSGFCFKHHEMMFLSKNRLSQALVLDSHIDELSKKLFADKNAFTFRKKSGQTDCLCYVCGRIAHYMDKIYETIFYLYKNEEEFRENLKKQPYFCLPHYNKLLQESIKSLQKKDYEDFSKIIKYIEEKAMSKLSGDIKWFCKKFDYRYNEEDWKDSKDAVERAIYMLTGETIKNK